FSVFTKRTNNDVEGPWRFSIRPSQGLTVYLTSLSGLCFSDRPCQGTLHHVKQLSPSPRLLKKGEGTQAQRLSLDIRPSKCRDDDNRQFRQSTGNGQNTASTEHRHPQVSDDQIESLFRICKFLHNCSWIRDAGNPHTFIRKHLNHCPKHSRIVIYDQNRFVLQLLHNLFKESCADGERKLNAKCAAFPPRRSAINPAAVFVNDPLHECKAEAGAIVLRSEERHEKISSFVLAHAAAVIADRHQSFRTVSLRADRQVSSIWHRIQCIPDQIQKGFPELLRIDVNRWQVRIKRAPQVHVLLLEQRLHKIKFFLKKAVE